jgi:hypothetical protein
MKAHWDLEMLPEEAFQKVGKNVKLYKKGGGGGQPTSQTVTQTNLPEYAKPYFENLLNRTQAQSYQQYQPYGAPRIAGFTPEQQGIMQSYSNLQTPGQFNQATQGLNLAGGMGAAGARAGLDQALAYQPSNYNAQQVRAPNLRNYQMANVADVRAPSLQNFGMNAAQTSFNPNLQNYQMAGPQNVASQNFGQAAADYYSNPYQQNVTNIALREAQQKGALDKNALMSGAIGRGTFGGARNALLQAEQTRGLNQQLGDIQMQGSQQGYLNAQQQFQADQARNMQAQLANQQSGLSTNQANLQAMLQTQGLGAGIGKDIALANLSNEQQANVQNLASQLQTQGLSADQALRAALANQQSALTTGQKNLDALLGVQSLGAGQNLTAQQLNQAANLQANQQNQQAQQYAAGLGQQLYGTGLGGVQGAATGLGALGAQEQTSNLARLGAQEKAAAQQQALQQTQYDTAYQDFLRQRDYPQEQLGFYSNILRGLPVQLASTQSTYQAPPNLGSQIAGAGLGLAGLSKLV